MEYDAMEHTLETEALETEALAIWPQEKPFLRRIFAGNGSIFSMWGAEQAGILQIS